MTFSKHVAVDVFKVRKEGSNDMDGILNFFSSLPKFILSFIVKIVLFLDNHGINPKALTEGDTNYATILFSNLGSIKTNSVYHHLNEYGTNSIVITAYVECSVSFYYAVSSETNFDFLKIYINNVFNHCCFIFRNC